MPRSFDAGPKTVLDPLHSLDLAMAAPAPESLPTPRGAHLEMMAAVLAGDGLGRVAEIASRHAQAPVVVVLPKLGLKAPDGPVTSSVPIMLGMEEVGTVVLMAAG